jgi:hypothetical protein
MFSTEQISRYISPLLDAHLYSWKERIFGKYIEDGSVIEPHAKDSSASHRELLASSPKIDASFRNLDVEERTLRPRTVQEALDAANEKIRQLEAANIVLSAQLDDSNKENRALKKQRTELLHKVKFLIDDLEDATEKRKPKALSSRTSISAPTSAKGRTNSPRKEWSAARLIEELEAAMINFLNHVNSNARLLTDKAAQPVCSSPDSQLLALGSQLHNHIQIFPSLFNHH